MTCRTLKDRTPVPHAGCEDRWFWARVYVQTGSGMWQTGTEGISSGRNSGSAEFLGWAGLRRRATPGPHRHSEGLGLSHAWTGNCRTGPEWQAVERHENVNMRLNLNVCFIVKQQQKVPVTWETFSYSPLDEAKWNTWWNLCDPLPEPGASSNPAPIRFLKGQI